MAVPRKLRCRVSRTTDHGDHVYTIEMEPETRPPAFRPGQFLHLALDDYDPSRFWPESRVFSIASPPATLPLRISYSVRGRYTARMEKELTVGRQVWVKLPYGDFAVDTTRPAALFAGGTGITAFTSFLSGAMLSDPLLLVYGARRPGLLLYRDLLERRVALCPLVISRFFCETPTPGATTGCISADAVWPDWPCREDSTCYLSGPPAMLKTLTAQLIGLGVSPDRIRIDAWE